jgi:hypothetical protein
MFLNRRLFVALAVCLMCLTSSSAFAGGGGSKKDATITVKNETSAVIGVAVDPSAALLAAVAAGDVEKFKSNGGKIVNPGDTARFSVKAGTHRIVVGDSDFNLIADESRVVNKGKTLKGFVSATGLRF